MQNPTNFPSTHFRAQSVFELFENTLPPPVFENLILIFGSFYIISSQVIYIDQILRCSIRYAKLRAISNFFSFFLYTL